MHDIADEVKKTAEAFLAGTFEATVRAGGAGGGRDSPSRIFDCME